LLIFCISCRENPELQALDAKNEHRRPPYFQILFDPDMPGCGDCHSSRAEPELSLAALANERWKDHNFDVESKLKTINDCLHCHSVDSMGAEGTIAPVPLRTIVHQAHMSGPHFKGNCFSCHLILGDSSPDLYNNSD